MAHRLALSQNLRDAIPGYSDQLSNLTVIFAGYNALHNLKLAPIGQTQGHTAIGARNVGHWLDQARVFQIRGQTTFLDPLGMKREMEQFLHQYAVLRNADGSVIPGPKVIVMAGVGDVSSSELTGFAPEQFRDALYAMSELRIPIIFCGLGEIPCLESGRGSILRILLDWALENQDNLSTHRVHVADIFTPVDPQDQNEVYQVGRGQIIVEAERAIEASLPLLVLVLKQFVMDKLGVF
jgi:hypothetical protein